MNHRTPPDVVIKRKQEAAKQKAMRTPEAPFDEQELDFLRISFPDLYDRVMATRQTSSSFSLGMDDPDEGSN